MSVQRQREVVAVDAASVVFNAQPVKAAALHGDGDRGGTSVKAVFNEFLDHLGGTLHHFTSGDETDGGLIELPNFLRLHAPSSRSFLSA